MLVIRRLRCSQCRRIHHELPDMLVPYKRYIGKSIEAALQKDPGLSAPADESTLQRWRGWFQEYAGYLVGCLTALGARYGIASVEGPSNLPESALQRIWRHVGEAPGWLARIVRPVANANLWPQTRLAFLSGQK